MSRMRCSVSDGGGSGVEGPLRSLLRKVVAPQEAHARRQLERKTPTMPLSYQTFVFFQPFRFVFDQAMLCRRCADGDAKHVDAGILSMVFVAKLIKTAIPCIDAQCWTRCLRKSQQARRSSNNSRQRCRHRQRLSHPRHRHRRINRRRHASPRRRRRNPVRSFVRSSISCLHSFGV